MLNEFQSAILDHGIWFLPLATMVALALFPWKHWNYLLDIYE